MRRDKGEAVDARGVGTEVIDGVGIDRDTGTAAVIVVQRTLAGAGQSGKTDVVQDLTTQQLAAIVVKILIPEGDRAALCGVIGHAADGYAAAVLPLYSNGELAGKIFPAAGAVAGVINDHCSSVAGGGDKGDVVQVLHAVAGIEGNPAAIVPLAHIIT